MRRVVLRFLAMLLAPALAVAAETAQPGGSATMQCDRIAEPGRLRCAVELRPPDGLEVRHADVVLVAAPDFVQPLKGRIGPDDAVAKDPLVWRWTLALVARKAGRGELSAEVRAVLCPRAQDRSCKPRSFPVKAEVVVGGSPNLARD
jgi:ABC-type amino acid transport substrate-binding protein